MVSKEDIIPELATWIRGDHDTKIAAVQVPMGLDSVDMIKAAVAEAGAEPVYVSMHGLAGVDMASAARSPIAVTFKKKVIVVFEYDAIASTDQLLMTHISAAMKINRVPIILVGNFFRTKATELPKGHVVFTVVSEDPHDHIRAVTNLKAKKDSLQDKGLAGAEAALRGIDQDYRGDGIALGGVFDNYLGAENPGIQRIAEAFSWSDVVGEGMCRVGTFEDPYSFVPVSTVAHAFRDTKTTLRINTFGTVWSKTNAMYAKVNSSRAVSRSLMDGGHTVYPWKTTTGLDFVRGMISNALADNNMQAAADIARLTGLTPASLLSLMRLWKSKYALSTHAKVKKFLDAP